MGGVAKLTQFINHVIGALLPRNQLNQRAPGFGQVPFKFPQIASQVPVSFWLLFNISFPII
jgi:hypothetical protein